MDIRGHRMGDLFRVVASPQERHAMLAAIADVGLRGTNREEARSSEVAEALVDFVSKADYWPRKYAHIMAAILDGQGVMDNPMVLWERELLSAQIKAALERWPERSR